MAPMRRRESPKATDVLRAASAGTPAKPRKKIKLASRMPQLANDIGTIAINMAIGTKAKSADRATSTCSAAASAAKIATRRRCGNVDDAQIIGALNGSVKAADSSRERAAILAIKGQRHSARNRT